MLGYTTHEMILSFHITRTTYIMLAVVSFLIKFRVGYFIGIATVIKFLFSFFYNVFI